jgi:hypothetical protein
MKIRATHPYGFRCGQWAELIGVCYIEERPCFIVFFPDVHVYDSWVVYDPSDPYEFKD